MKKNITRVMSVIIALFLVMSAFSVTAFASEPDRTITSSDRVNMIITIDGQRAYCVERNEIMPDAGLSYHATSFSHPARLDRVVVAISQMRDGSNAFEIASQYAIWQCYESLDMVLYSSVIDGAEVSNHVAAILNAADMIDMNEWSVFVAFYACEGYQTVATFGVNYIAPVVIPEEEDDKPEVVPETVPETEPEEEEVPEETVPETEPEVEEVPEETVPEETVPEETTPETEPEEEEVPEETVPETEPEVEEVPETEPEEEEIPEETIPEEVPEETTPETEPEEEEVPEETVPETEPEVEEVPETEPEEEEVPEETVPETEPETEPTNPDPVIPPQEVLGGEPTAPQTGDDSNIVIWFALMAVAAAGVVFAIKAKRN